ncbi:TPA: hypothetical protein ACP7Q6_004758 [Escherichia coli]
MKILVISNSGQERIINLNNPTFELLSDNDLKKSQNHYAHQKTGWYVLSRMVIVFSAGTEVMFLMQKITGGKLLLTVLKF